MQRKPALHGRKRRRALAVNWLMGKWARKACDCGQDGQKSAGSGASISARATASTCPYCMEALHLFCALLGTVAADLALTLGARGGVYLGGGILGQLGRFFTRSAFRQRFEDKGRFSAYLAQIPTFIIDAPYAALSGAAIALESPLCIGYESTERAQ